MTMLSNLTFAITLIALASGIGLLIWSMRNDGAGVTIAKIFGYIISIISIIVMIFTLYFTIHNLSEMKKMMQTGCPMCNMMMSNKCMMMNNSKMPESKPGMMPDTMNNTKTPPNNY